MPLPPQDLPTTIISKLKAANHQLVLAESCTAGLACSTLTGVPGASAVLVGSAVVYQVETKMQWLGIPDSHFQSFDVVSAKTSQVMAEQILEKTPFATIAATITGHLGPDAPDDLDGIAWASVAIKEESTVTVNSKQFQLDSQILTGLSPLELRHQRQRTACEELLTFILQTLRRSSPQPEQA